MANQDWQSEKPFSETNLNMLKSQLLTDVTFLVGEQGETILAHKFILVSRSCVFEAMFCGPMAEKSIVDIPDVDRRIFEDFLRYIYSDDVILQPDTVLPLLYVAKKYSVKSLEKKCIEFCDSTLSSENACEFLQQAYIFDEESLKTKALAIIAKNGSNCLASDGFKDLGRDCLDMVLQSDELIADEINVYKAVITWAKAECERTGRKVTVEDMRNVLGKSLYLIRFPLISQEDLAASVAPEKLLSDSQLEELSISYPNPKSPTGQFSAKKRKCFLFTLNRSMKKPHTIRTTTRKDALLLSCDKDVTLHALHVYGGDIGSSYQMMVDLYITNKAKDGISNEQSVEVMVTQDEVIYRMPLAVPWVMTSGCEVLVRVKCDGPKRWLCKMNNKSEMFDESSGTEWNVSHSGESDSDNSLYYGLICGFDFSLN